MPKSDVIDRFLERMGLAAEQDRLPRIAGQLMGLLLVAERPLSLEDVAGRLQISRASVSTNSRLLESFGVLERVGQVGSRRGYFRIAPRPGQELLRVSAKSLQERARMLGDTRRQLDEIPDAQDRLAELERFYAAVARSIEGALRELEGAPSHVSSRELTSSASRGLES